MRKILKLCILLALTALVILIVNRYMNTRLTINGNNFYLGKFEFDRKQSKLYDTKKPTKILTYSYSTFNSKYHVKYCIVEPMLSDTVIYFDNIENETYFNIQSERREIFYKPIGKSLILKLKRIDSKYKIDFSGVVYSKTKKDSLVIESSMELQPK